MIANLPSVLLAEPFPLLLGVSLFMPVIRLIACGVIEADLKSPKFLIVNSSNFTF